MKKFLSMFLVLTMVVTTLMGVMVIDVSAVSTADFSESVSVTPATESASRKIMYTFGLAGLPAVANTDRPLAASYNRYATGEWYATGYKYDSVLDASNVQNIDATGKYDAVKFADVSVVNNPLDPTNNGEMSKISFKNATIKDDTWTANGKTGELKNGSTSISKITANYFRFKLMGNDLATNYTSSNFNEVSSFQNITSANLSSAVTAEKAYVYTFYAYTNKSAKANGIQFKVYQSSSARGSMDFPEQYIYSESALNDGTKGVPHKVQFVISGTATTKGNVFYHLYIDGVEMGSGVASTSDFTGTMQVQLAQEMNFSNKASMTIKEADWYVSKAPTGLIAPKLMTEDELKNELVVVPYMNAKTMATTYRTDDYITGVIASLDADIKAVLETTTAGDKVVDITESKYNNPVSLFDTTVENATVKLVSRTTGEEVAPASATGTMDDYYFMVNGIYIIPNKVADPLPYYKTSTDPFDVSASNHQATVTRIHYENYEDNVMDEDLPALGGLRSGFLKYTNAPRGTFSFYNGNIKYGTNDGYYAIKTPQIKLADHGDLDKKLTLEFDMYVPEFVTESAANGESLRITLNAHADPSVTGTNSSGNGKDIDTICFTTNGLTGSGFSAKRVADLEGNAWNTVAITFDSTDTATDGKYDISVYVNGELQLEYETSALFKDNAAGTEAAGGRLCSLNICRLYMPLYTSVGVMNDAWYAGNYTIEKTAVAEGTLDSTKVSGVEISVDNDNNLVAYDNANDTDNSALISAMSVAGYQPVYTQVVNVDLINEKYDEVDGLIENIVNEDGTRTVTGKLVKKWMDNSGTKSDVVASIDENGFSTYTIKDANITAAVDNGDGTASMTIKSGFGNTGSYNGIASTYEDIIASLAAENPPRIGRTLELTGFAVVEDGKLPKIYSLQEMGTDLYTLAYDETTKVATLNYREFGGTDNIPFILLVGAYDANGKMLALDVSEAMAIDSANEADGVKTKTFTADFGELDLTTVRKYKVFAFNSLAERKPIMTNYLMINPAYVAPTE